MEQGPPRPALQAMSRNPNKALDSYVLMRPKWAKIGGTIEDGVCKAIKIDVFAGEPACKLKKTSKAYKMYKNEEIVERHRHRYEVNPYYKDMIISSGLDVVGTSIDGKLVEMGARDEQLLVEHGLGKRTAKMTDEELATLLEPRFWRHMGLGGNRELAWLREESPWGFWHFHSNTRGARKKTPKAV